MCEVNFKLVYKHTVISHNSLLIFTEIVTRQNVLDPVRYDEGKLKWTCLISNKQMYFY